MLMYTLAPEDLGEIRFAISPAVEATLSLRALPIRRATGPSFPGSGRSSTASRAWTGRSSAA